MVHRILFLLFFSSILLCSQQFPNREVHNLLVSGINEVLNQEYSSANTTFLKLKKNYPDLPLGDIYLASVEIAKCYDFRIPFDDSKIISYLDRAKVVSEILLGMEPNSLWNKYFLGLSEGYTAYYNALKENWIPAFTKGLSAVDIFKNILSDSSDFYEAYAPVGTYYYWKSKKLESFNWLPFIEDETRQGIEYLEKAANKSSYNRYLAVYSLIWIYIEQDEYEKAIKFADDMLKDYPENRFFKYALARALEDTDKKRSIKTYYEILYSYQSPGLLNEITLKHKIARQHYLLGENKECLKLCNEILSKNTGDEPGEEVLSRLERVRGLYLELTN